MEENIFIICLISIIFFAFFMIKNLRTYDVHTTIRKAIYSYRIACIEALNLNDLDLVKYDDAENYIKTVFRFWDWGYTRILPKDKFEIIKPYIKK